MQLPKLLRALTWSVILSHVPINLWTQDLPALGTQAVNLDGQPVATETTFTGGFSVDNTTFQSDGTIAAQPPVTIKGTITVDHKQVGQTADLIVYINYGLLDQPLTPETSTALMVGENTTILPWNSDITSLIPFMKQVQLQATQAIDIFKGPLADSRLQIFFGYRLADGTLITNKVPISLAVETTPEAVDAAPETPAAAEETVRVDSTPLNLGEDESGRLVGLIGSRWPVGSTLKVAFDFGDLAYPTYTPAVCYRGMPKDACQEAIADNVIKVASTWSQYGNLYFRRVYSWTEGDIRIRFQESGSYSRGLGTQIKNVPANEHTMNFAINGFLAEPSWSTATILREFGHAIGLAHEHNSPKVAFTWNEAAVIADLKRTQG